MDATPAPPAPPAAAPPGRAFAALGRWRGGPGRFAAGFVVGLLILSLGGGILLIVVGDETCPRIQRTFRGYASDYRYTTIDPECEARYGAAAMLLWDLTVPPLLFSAATPLARLHEPRHLRAQEARVAERGRAIRDWFVQAQIGEEEFHTLRGKLERFTALAAGPHAPLGGAALLTWFAVLLLLVPWAVMMLFFALEELGALPLPAFAAAFGIGLTCILPVLSFVGASRLRRHARAEHERLSQDWDRTEMAILRNARSRGSSTPAPANTSASLGTFTPYGGKKKG